MLFNSDECAIIIGALETYDEIPRGILKPNVQHDIASSASRKLSEISSLTNFTKQELTVMALAVQFIIGLSDNANSFLVSDLISLRDKLISLAS